MELANMAFHSDTPGRFSVLGKRMRETNLKEKVGRLFDESKGKQSILKRYLSDAVRQLNYVEIDDISNTSEHDEYVKTLDCAFQESAISEDISDKHFGVDSEYYQGKVEFPRSRNSSSSSLVFDVMDVDLVRTPGDGREVSDSVDEKFADSKSDYCSRIVIGTERHNMLKNKAFDKWTSLKKENGIKDVLKKEIGDKAKEEAINKELDQIISKNDKVRKVENKHCDCNALTESRKRLKHKSAGKLKGLLRLYKTMKMRKKFVRKCIANNITCLTPLKSRTCLNSAFINDQTRIEGQLSASVDTRLNLSSVDKDRLKSESVDETKECNPAPSTFIVNTTANTSSVLNAAFISHDLMDSIDTCVLTERETFMQEHITVTDIYDDTRNELNIAKLESQFLPLYQNTTNCSTTFQEFAYFNNGFVMD